LYDVTLREVRLTNSGPEKAMNAALAKFADGPPR